MTQALSQGVGKMGEKGTPVPPLVVGTQMTLDERLRREVRAALKGCYSSLLASSKSCFYSDFARIRKHLVGLFIYAFKYKYV